MGEPDWSGHCLCRWSIQWEILSKDWHITFDHSILTVSLMGLTWRMLSGVFSKIQTLKKLMDKVPFPWYSALLVEGVPSIYEDCIWLVICNPNIHEAEAEGSEVQSKFKVLGVHVGGLSLSPGDDQHLIDPKRAPIDSLSSFYLYLSVLCFSLLPSTPPLVFITRKKKKICVSQSDWHWVNLKKHTSSTIKCIFF